MRKPRKVSRLARSAAHCLSLAMISPAASAAQPGFWNGEILRHLYVDPIGGFKGAQSAAEACKQAGYDLTSRPDSAPLIVKSASGSLSDWPSVRCEYTNGVIGRVGIISRAECPEGEKLSPASGQCVKVVDRQHRRNACFAAGNPIYPLQGNKRQEEMLGRWLKGMPLMAVYDSLPKLNSPNGKPAFVGKAPPSFGALWQSSLHKGLQIQRDHDGKLLAVQAARGGGMWTSFLATSDTAVTAAADVNDRLIHTSGTWHYIDSKALAIETYDANGQLQTVDYAQGAKLTYTYSTAAAPLTIAPQAGLLVEVQDRDGRAVKFTYEAPGGTLAPRIKSISNESDQITSIAYDDLGNLTQLTWPDGHVRKYLYENENWALTGIISENDTRLSTYGYTGSGLANSTELSGGAFRYQVNYNTAPSWEIADTYDATAQIYVRDHLMKGPTGLVLTLPNGDTSQIGTSVVLGTVQPISQTQSAGAGCAASSNALAYDANGNVASSDNFNKHRTCYVHDASNRQTSRVEGLANTTACSSVNAAGSALPGGSRKISTAYHPDWRLAVKIAEPGRLTTLVYNGQPDPTNSNLVASCAGGAMLPDGKPIAVLCKRVEQATTDSDGRLGFDAALQSGVLKRQDSWTYDTAGRVLTATDPLNRVTTYTYYADTTNDHTIGDLHSITNAKNQVTAYHSYDRLGHLLQSTDPNGVVSSYTYNSRQQIRTVSTGASTTSYDYWPNGQLKRMTSPDASYLDYTYDPAQRLTLISDSAGNQIQYDYDKLGNRIDEKILDPAGQLVRQVTRVIDALGRVQQTTGR